jgi:hypothetical protein
MYFPLSWSFMVAEICQWIGSLGSPAAGTRIALDSPSICTVTSARIVPTSLSIEHIRLKGIGTSR